MNSFPHIYPGAPSGPFSPQWQRYFEVTDPLPNVTFPISRSFAGNLPVDRAGHPNDTLFFWAFEHEEGSLTSESKTEPWGIWLNGGSYDMIKLMNSVSYLSTALRMDPCTLMEIIPWLQTRNFHGIVWQTTGVGFSTADSEGEDQMGTDFLGFLSNLVKVFPSLAKRPLHLTGESYAGTYIPYILKAYFESPNPPVNIVKIAIGDGTVGSGAVFEELPALIGYDPEVFKYFEQQSHLCGYDVNLTYPQNGIIPTVEFIAPGGDNASGDFFTNRLKFAKNRTFRSRLLARLQERSETEDIHPQAKSLQFRKREERRQTWVDNKRGLMNRGGLVPAIDPQYGCDLLSEFIDHAINFTFPWTLGGYDLTRQVYDVPDALNPEVPIDASVFMNDNRTRTALHAPTSKDWVLDFDFPFGILISFSDLWPNCDLTRCGTTLGPEPMVFLTELATNATKKNVGIVLFSGNDDSLVAHRGTEVVIQNTTFGGIQGFTRRPATPWTGSNGEFAGIVHQERGWTYVLFKGAGHLVGNTAPANAKVFIEEFVFGNNPTGLVKEGGVVGGEDPALAEDVLPGSDPIFYGSLSTESSTIWPAATRAAWSSFIRTATASTTATATRAPHYGARKTHSTPSNEKRKIGVGLFDQRWNRTRHFMLRVSFSHTCNHHNMDASSTSSGTMDTRRREALNSYRDVFLSDSTFSALSADPHLQKLRSHETSSESLKNLRFSLKDLEREYEKTEEDIKAVQSVGQIIGEVMKQLDDERFIVKASSGPRYVVSYRPTLPAEKLKNGTRVSLDMTTLTVMRILPREVDPLVYKMSLEDPGGASFAGIGGLTEQVRELREIIELPILNPELFQRVGITPPKGVLLYGPPGTGKTLLARAVAATLQTNFLKVVSSAIVDKYIGESARVIREMFGYAREHEPCVIFMDEIDAIGGRRFSEGTSADREIQRTLMELLNQMDGFDSLGRTKLIMATNRPDTLDPALLRPGRLDRKIEIPLPNEQARLEILKIHCQPVNKAEDIDYEAIVKLSDGFNGADLRNVVTEAGMCAIRDDREYINQEDLTKSARKVSDAKKHETTLEHSV
ncbi:hypothetical protein D9757_008056 [Collybiopsis confluens]|uniref:AAA+ ATPase domain-containing protein n=1 Tax=Collybiopsis confluens TaxID=2823264 RepID=A0A8H5H6P1_9AGAR|nr:hypothetical protein D9757_008056 [Collybiopsis confluens]